MRYVICGEYGGKYERPHYHVLLFNLPTKDRIDHKLYVIQEIERAWNMGLVHCGEITEASIDYVASYIAGVRLGFEDKGRMKPFLEMSRRPGIGYEYVNTMKKYHQSDPLNRSRNMSKAYRNGPLGKYYKQKIYDKEQLKLIANENVEHFYDKVDQENRELLAKGIDPEQYRIEQQQIQFRKMAYKKRKKVHK